MGSVFCFWQRAQGSTTESWRTEGPFFRPVGSGQVACICCAELDPLSSVEVEGRDPLIAEKEAKGKLSALAGGSGTACAQSFGLGHSNFSVTTRSLGIVPCRLAVAAIFSFLLSPTAQCLHLPASQYNSSSAPFCSFRRVTCCS